MKQIFYVSSFFILAISASTLADSKGHGAHVHGIAQIKIAVDGSKATLLFESPSDSLYGFEYEAKSSAEKAKQNSALEILRTRMSSLLILDPKLNCKISTTKLEVVKEEGEDHREVQGEWALNCAAPIAKSKAKLAFTKNFPRIQNIHVDVLSDSNQSAFEIKKDKGEIQF